MKEVILVLAVQASFLGDRLFAQVITLESAYRESEVVGFVQIVGGRLEIHDELHCGATYQAEVLETFKGPAVFADATLDFSSQTSLQTGRYYLVFLVHRESNAEAQLLPLGCEAFLPALTPLMDGRTLLNGTETLSLNNRPNGLEFGGLWEFPTSVPFAVVRYETDLGGLIRKKVDTSLVLEILRGFADGN
jgi:hypothetical protein